jgi:hypothetical protein
MEKIKQFWNEMVRYLTEVWTSPTPQGRGLADNGYIKLSTKVVIASSIGMGVFY